MSGQKSQSKSKVLKGLVQDSAAKLRELVLEREPGALIGSLDEVAEMLGVGIITVQQAARILEHEGFLEVRRGPGGGYYGVRPDEAALERFLSAFMRVRGFGYREALEMIVLLDCEVMPAAARSNDAKLFDGINMLLGRLDSCDTVAARVQFEIDLRELLLRHVARPVMEMLMRSTMKIYTHKPGDEIFTGSRGVAHWKKGRTRMLQAILQQDAELASFEADRFRKQVLDRLR